MNSNVFLWGMPGSGKSTFGLKLSKKMAFNFFDLDKEIEKKEKLSVTEIFASKGEDYFRKIESEILKSQKHENTIISCGGGTPCFHNNADWMNENGLTIYLNLNIKTIHQRLWNSNDHNRPLLKGKNEEELMDYLVQLLHQREIFYTKAKIHFNPLNSDAISDLISKLIT